MQAGRWVCPNDRQQGFIRKDRRVQHDMVACPAMAMHRVAGRFQCRPLHFPRTVQRLDWLVRVGEQFFGDRIEFHGDLPASTNPVFGIAVWIEQYVEIFAIPDGWRRRQSRAPSLVAPDCHQILDQVFYCGILEYSDVRANLRTGPHGLHQWPDPASGRRIDVLRRAGCPNDAAAMALPACATAAGQCLAARRLANDRSTSSGSVISRCAIAMPKAMRGTNWKASSLGIVQNAATIRHKPSAKCRLRIIEVNAAMNFSMPASP